MPDKYLVISPENLVPSIQPLIQQKQNRGYEVIVKLMKDFCDMAVMRLTGAGLVTDWKGFNVANRLGTGESRWLTTDMNGNARKELIVVSNDGLWLTQLRKGTSGVELGWQITGWINHTTSTGDTGWHLRRGDRFVSADVNGDGRDELVVLSANGEWMGSLKQVSGRLVADWIAFDWVTPPGGPANSGWNLGEGDQILGADIDGDGCDELVVTSHSGQWIGILRETSGRPVATWVHAQWINAPGGSGATGWCLQQGDRFLAGDFNGDGRQELLVVAASGQWLGLLEESGGQLVVTGMSNDWVNPPGGSGASGWNLQQGDQFLVADIDNDHRDEVIVVAPSGQWIGVLRENGGRFAAQSVQHDWVNAPGGTGATGWHLSKGDTYLVGDINGDSKAEIVVISPSGEYVGWLGESAGTLAIFGMVHGEVNLDGGPSHSGWNLQSGDKYAIADVDGDARAELLVFGKTRSYQQIRTCVLNTAPRFLLLVGDCDITPGYPLWRPDSTPLMRFISDAYLGIGSDVPCPQVMIGRLSSNDPVELKAICDRILAYHNLADSMWMRRVILSGFLPGATQQPDSVDSGWRCLGEMGHFFQPVLEYQREGTPERQRVWGAEDSTKASLKSAIEQGALMVLYTGHGWPAGWDSIGNNEDFTCGDVEGLNVGAMTPLVISASCLTGQIKVDASFAERWLRKGKAIGILAADEVSSTFFNDRILPPIIHEIVNHRTRLVGEILKNAIKYVYDEYHDDPLCPIPFFGTTLLMYRYLGDPDTVLASPMIREKTLSEKASCGPAIAAQNGAMLLSWIGPPTNHKLNFVRSSDGWTFTNKVTLNETSREAPALAVFQGKYVVAWTGMDAKLNIMQSSDGTTWSNKTTLNETSPSSPALTVLGNRLYLAWRGNPSNNCLNVIHSNDGISWTGKHTLSETSPSGPALASMGSHLYLAWRGGPSNNLVNVMRSTNGSTFTDKKTLSEKTGAGPALAAYSDHLYLAWEGVNNQFLNVRQSPDGVTWPSNKNTFSGEKCMGGPSLTALDNRFVWAWTGVDSDHHVNVMSYVLRA